MGRSGWEGHHAPHETPPGVWDLVLMISKIGQAFVLLLVAGAFLFISLEAYFLYYTSGELPMMQVRRGAAGAARYVFHVSLMAYALFILIGLTCLRFVLSHCLGKEAAARQFDRLAVLCILPVLLVVGFVGPLVIGG
jgi:hypothetical protein